MAKLTLESGRVIDNSCPYADSCFSDGGCPGTCPPSVLDALRVAARAEHELGWPHTDPDIAAVCECRFDKQKGRQK